MSRNMSIFARGLAIASLLGLGASMAHAGDSVTLNVGPIPVPNVPVSVCANGVCATTPAISSVSLSLTGSVAATLPSLPLVVPSLCPNGKLGLAVTVTAVGGSLSLSGAVSGTVPPYLTYSKPIGPISLAPGGTANVSACIAL